MSNLDDVSLPHAVALSWGVAEQPHKGPKRELSIERIVESAIEIADAEGLAALSMNRVATSLGFTTMSLYRYITSKDDLLLLMQDAAIDIPTSPATEPADWRAELREWMLLTMEVIRAHPWFTDIPVQGVPITPNNLRIVDWGLRSLRSTPLSDTEKMATILLATGYTRTYGMLERDLHRATADGAPRAAVPGTNFTAALLELVTPERFPFLLPVLASGAYTDDVERDTDDFDDFGFGLERILDGIERFVTERATETDATGAAAIAAAPRSEPDQATRDRRDFYPKDPKVRDAAHARREAEQRVREAEQKLRDAVKKEREALAKARERATKQAEADARRASKKRGDAS
jgi:AcrR family transcriptional regulator